VCWNKNKADLGKYREVVLFGDFMVVFLLFLTLSSWLCKKKKTTTQNTKKNPKPVKLSIVVKQS